MPYTPALFDVKEHTINASYIREYARATSTSQSDTLVQHVKQYIPKSNQNPQKGDVTLIGAHANGFPKVSLSLSPAFFSQFTLRISFSVGGPRPRPR